MDFVYVTPLTNAMIDCTAGGSITYKDIVFLPGGSSALYLVRQHVTVMWVLMANGRGTFPGVAPCRQYKLWGWR